MSECPHSRHFRPEIVSHRGAGSSSGEGASANAIVSPHPAQLTAKYHFPAFTRFSLGITAPFCPFNLGVGVCFVKVIIPLLRALEKPEKTN